MYFMYVHNCDHVTKILLVPPTWQNFSQSRLRKRMPKVALKQEDVKINYIIVEKNNMYLFQILICLAWNATF